MWLRELPPGDVAWTQAFEVLRQLRGHLDRASFDAVHRAGHAQGLRFTAAFAGPAGDEAGQPTAGQPPTGGHATASDADEATCLGLAGWRIVDTASVVRKLHVDDLVVDATHRSAGIGAALLAHLEQVAREHGARCVELESGHPRTHAHRFYRRAGYEDTGLTFRKRLPPGT